MHVCVCFIDQILDSFLPSFYVWPLVGKEGRAQTGERGNDETLGVRTKK